MSEYTEQAKNFLNKANATMTIELVGCDVPTHWKGETRKHNHYKFTITTPRGKMEDDFWDSIHNTELSQMTFDGYCCRHYGMHSDSMSYTEENKAKRLWKEQINEAIPTEYDILACLETYVPDTFDDFCGEFGYDNDSISALNIYLACQKQMSALRKIFTSEQLEELAEIN